MKLFFLLTLFSLQVFAVETEKDRLIARLKMNNSEVIEVVKGTSQDRRYRIINNNNCRAETPKQWDRAAQYKALRTANELCKKDLAASYPNEFESGKYFCHPGVMFPTDSPDPMEESRFYIENSYEDLRARCYVVYDNTYRSDFEMYFSAIMEKK
jgi:hypothetical protein